MERAALSRNLVFEETLEDLGQSGTQHVPSGNDLVVGVQHDRPAQQLVGMMANWSHGSPMPEHTGCGTHWLATQLNPGWQEPQLIVPLQLSGASPQVASPQDGT